ncbi:MAG: thermonuclease family protein, partial [Ardenticatenales bacterium]|nr:thermonuclease family protein [Ardenticatenales bacterium]
RLRLANGQEVRLAAIEVPALGQPFAEEGKQATRALTLGKEIRLEGELDNAYIYLPTGELLQEMLLSGGYARLARDLPQSELVAQLRSAEAQAQNQGLGIWEGGPPSVTFPTLVPTSGPVTCDASLIQAENPIRAEEAKDHLGEEAMVVFFPIRTESRNGDVTILAGVEESTFGIVIPFGIASTIDDPGALYLHRCIAVAGRIEQSVAGGPRITLRAINQVIILR